MSKCTNSIAWDLVLGGPRDGCPIPLQLLGQGLVPSAMASAAESPHPRPCPFQGSMSSDWGGDVKEGPLDLEVQLWWVMSPQGSLWGRLHYVGLCGSYTSPCAPCCFPSFHRGGSQAHLIHILISALESASWTIKLWLLKWGQNKTGSIFLSKNLNYTGHPQNSRDTDC